MTKADEIIRARVVPLLMAILGIDAETAWERFQRGVTEQKPGTLEILRIAFLKEIEGKDN